MEMIQQRKISSIPLGLINQRFFIKSSMMEIPGMSPSIIVSVYDINEDGYLIKHFNNEDSAVDFINLIKAAY